MANIRKQLSIFLEDRPGTLAAVAEELFEENINILAMTVSDTVDHAVVRFLVDKPGKAIEQLESKGHLVVENDVILVDLENKPGTLAELARRLADENINIEYAYCTAIPAQQKGLIVLRVSEPREALELID